MPHSFAATLTSTDAFGEHAWTFHFKNAANKAAFEADPWRYAPQFGGFCAWGMATEWPDKGWRECVGHAVTFRHRSMLHG